MEAVVKKFSKITTIKPTPIAKKEAPCPEYKELADRLGVATPEIDGINRQNAEAVAYNKVVEFLSARGLVIYPYDEVMSFLKAQCPTNGSVVVWKILRKKDLQPNSAPPHYGMPHGYKLWGLLYNRTVPLAALMLVEEMSKAIPDAIFWVSDYEAPRPDPFLAVTLLALGDKCLVIDHWDEPGFGIKKEAK